MREPEILPKTALVTGGAKRLGRALVEALRAHGWRVAVHYNSSSEEVRDLEGPLLQADLTDGAQAAELVSRASEALQAPLGLLVNNASPFIYDTWDTATPELWDLHMNVNLRAPFLLSQAFGRQSPEGQGGLIVNLLDQRVWNLNAHFMTYTLSKAGLWTLTQTLAQALAPQGIRVNGIAPGPTLPSTRQSDAHFARQVRETPLGRAVNPEDIAKALLYLIEARATTGVMVPVDSGQHLNWAAPSPNQPIGE